MIEALAARYARYGGPDVVRLETITLAAPGSGQLRVRVRASALNPKDVIVQSGRFPLYRLLAGRTFPKGIGFDWSGEVEALGPGVTGVSIGDAVHGMIGGWQGRACATHAIVSARETVAKPAVLSWEDAAALPLASLTALQALRDVARVRAGARVIVNGASGGVGVAAVQIAKALGAEVTAVTSAKNAELVRSLGAGRIVDYEKDDLGTVGLHDAFFDVVGNRGFAFARSLLGPHGSFVTTVPSGALLRARVLTAFGRGQRARIVDVRSRARDLATIDAWVVAGKMRAVVDASYPLSAIAEAEARVSSRRARGKIVLVSP